MIRKKQKHGNPTFKIYLSKIRLEIELFRLELPFFEFFQFLSPIYPLTALFFHQLLFVKQLLNLEHFQIQFSILFLAYRAHLMTY